ncbi:MAG: hypothetical protein DMF87_24565 [Acidobacteria bacterium]|nr:MAG: hypothetical protein DMF87_24565 [Acidobacteriota bacterium]
MTGYLVDLSSIEPGLFSAVLGSRSNQLQGENDAKAEVATSEEIAVTLRVFNLPNGSTASHIHVGPKGVSGPVVIDFPIGSGRTGDFTLQFRVHDGPAFHARPEIGIRTFGDALQAIAGGNAYVNIHTSAFPGGEIRGQLSVADPNTPVFPAQ